MDQENRKFHEVLLDYNLKIAGLIMCTETLAPAALESDENLEKFTSKMFRAIKTRAEGDQIALDRGEESEVAATDDLSPANASADDQFREAWQGIRQKTRLLSLEQLLYRSILVFLCSAYESLIADVIHLLFSLRPESLEEHGKKTIEYQELMEFESIQDAQESLINGIIEKMALLHLSWRKSWHQLA